MLHMVLALEPDNLPVVVLQFVFNGDSEEGATKFERFVKLGPIMNKSETIPYLKLNTLHDPETEHGDCRLLQGNYIPVVPTGLPTQFILSCFDQWHKFITDNPLASRSIMTIEIYHPAKWSSVLPDATAYVHRNPTYNIQYLPHWMDPAFMEHAAGALVALDQGFLKARDEFIGRGATEDGGYTNYMDHTSRTAGTAWLQRRFGDNYLRLIEVKQKYDPVGVFGRWFTAPKELNA